MEIKILGTGCSKCKQLEKIVTEFIISNNIDANIQKVEDIKEIIKYTMTTPTLVVDENVVFKGKIPTKEELVKILL